MRCRIASIAMVVSFLLAVPAYGVSIDKLPFLVRAVDEDKGLAERAMATLQEAAQEFSQSLPVGTQPIEVVIAESLPAFRSLAGPIAALDVNGIARPWEGAIVVKAPYLTPSQSDFKGTLRHELVHVLLFRNSNTDRMPRWLNEGISMMLANEFRWESSFAVARMFIENRVIEFRWIDKVLTAPESGMQFGDAYAQSLSMTRYLHDMVGAEAFWKMVAGLKEETFGDSMRRHAGISPLDFWDAYRGSLWNLAFWSFLTPSSLLGVGGFLVVIVWFVKRRSNRQTIERWDREDFEDALYGGKVTTWEELVEDPDAWKRGKDDSDP